MMLATRKDNFELQRLWCRSIAKNDLGRRTTLLDSCD
jgi:hypothetical protein